MKLFVYTIRGDDNILESGRVEKRSIASALRWASEYADSHFVLSDFDTVEVYIRESN